MARGGGRTVIGKLREATVGRGGGGDRKGPRGATAQANPGTEGRLGSHGRIESAGLGTGVTTGMRATALSGLGSESSETIGVNDLEAPSGGSQAVKWTGDTVG